MGAENRWKSYGGRRKMSTLNLSDKIFVFANHMFLIFVFLMTLYPLLFVLSASVSEPASVTKGELLLFPVGFTMEGYRHLLKYKDIWSGYGNAFFYTITGTFLNLLGAVLWCQPLELLFHGNDLSTGQIEMAPAAVSAGNTGTGADGGRQHRRSGCAVGTGAHAATGYGQSVEICSDGSGHTAHDGFVSVFTEIFCQGRDDWFDKRMNPKIFYIKRREQSK